MGIHFMMYRTSKSVSVFFLFFNICAGFAFHIDGSIEHSGSSINDPRNRVACRSGSGYPNLANNVKSILKRAHFRDESFDAAGNGFNLAHIYPEEKISTHLYDYVVGGDMNRLQELIINLFKFDEDAYVYEPDT